MTDNTPTEHELKLRWSRFLEALDVSELSNNDFEDGKREPTRGRDLSEPIKDSARHGLYFYVDGNGGVLYVGVAGKKAFGDRFWAHFGTINAPDEAEGWSQARHFQPLKLRDNFPPEKLVYLAALEAYLIATLRPPLNRSVGGVPVHRDVQD